MTVVSFLVELEVDHPNAVDYGDLADCIQNCVESAIDDGALDYMHGNGPNPPYESRPRLVGVAPEME